MKAAVLPEPVGAHASTSRFYKGRGVCVCVCVWCVGVGVGVVRIPAT